MAALCVETRLPLWEAPTEIQEAVLAYAMRKGSEAKSDELLRRFKGAQG